MQVQPGHGKERGILSRLPTGPSPYRTLHLPRYGSAIFRRPGQSGFRASPEPSLHCPPPLTLCCSTSNGIFDCTFWVVPHIGWLRRPKQHASRSRSSVPWPLIGLAILPLNYRPLNIHCLYASTSSITQQPYASSRRPAHLLVVTGSLPASRPSKFMSGRQHHLSSMMQDALRVRVCISPSPRTATSASDRWAPDPLP